MKLFRLFATLLATVAMVACGDKEPIENPDNQGGAPDGALMPPSGVAVVEGTLTTTSVTINWEAVQGAVGYQYVLQKGAMRVKSEQTTATEVTFNDLEKQTDYRFYLYALAEGGKGNSNSSEVLNFRTLSKEPSASGLPVPNLVVDCKGSGDYTTVGAALAAVPSSFEGNYIIHIKEGTYKEKLSVMADNVILVGDGVDKTILSHDGYQGNGESVYSTLYIRGKNVTVMDMTIENTHQNLTGKGDQAQAVHVHYGDKVAFYDCRITGYQDTFWGRSYESRVYVKDCYVEGNVDYIYGGSVMLFEKCTLHVNRNNSVLTAPSTPASAKFGIVFMDCTITTPKVGTICFDNKAFNYFYLGRPWQNAPKSVFIRCEEPAALHADGWTTMESLTNITFAEWKCKGEGYKPDGRKNYGRQLTDEEGAEYTHANIFAANSNPSAGFKEDWMPSAEKPEISLE